VHVTLSPMKRKNRISQKLFLSTLDHSIFRLARTTTPSRSRLLSTTRSEKLPPPTSSPLNGLSQRLTGREPMRKSHTVGTQSAYDVDGLRLRSTANRIRTHTPQSARAAEGGICLRACADGFPQRFARHLCERVVHDPRGQ